MRSLLAALALFLMAAASAQIWPGEPAPSPEVKAAIDQARAGHPETLLKLAEGAHPDAQAYAGRLLMFGGPGAKRDAAKGCAYEEKASAARADAMHLVGMCAENGLAGPADPKKAEAAYRKAADMGFPKSRCALGQMLMRQPADAQRGLLLCKESAQAGDADAQMTVADAYFNGGAVAKDRKEARSWYEKAAAQKNPTANRRVGEMYANGDGGKKDMKKAIDYWKKAEAAGDPMSSILVADALFSELTGGKTPGPGKYAFKGGIPLQDVETTEAWYQDALKRDPRPDVKPRAQEAIRVLEGFKQAGQVKTDKTKKK